MLVRRLFWPRRFEASDAPAMESMMAAQDIVLDAKLSWAKVFLQWIWLPSHSLSRKCCVVFIGLQGHSRGGISWTVSIPQWYVCDFTTRTLFTLVSGLSRKMHACSKGTSSCVAPTWGPSRAARRNNLKVAFFQKDVVFHRVEWPRPRWQVTVHTVDTGGALATIWAGRPSRTGLCIYCDACHNFLQALTQAQQAFLLRRGATHVSSKFWRCIIRACVRSEAQFEAQIHFWLASFSAFVGLTSLCT